MKRFLFPFEALERLRRRRREACELALAQARVAREREAARLSALALERDEAEAHWREAMPARGPLDVREIASRRAYLGILGQRIAVTTRALETSDREVAARRKAVLEASRAEKAVTRLRERRRTAWLAAGAREEQAFVDEVGLLAHRQAVRALGRTA
jgi:flagellar export protein FliJ